MRFLSNGFRWNLLNSLYSCIFYFSHILIIEFLKYIDSRRSCKPSLSSSLPPPPPPPPPSSSLTATGLKPSSTSPATTCHLYLVGVLTRLSPPAAIGNTALKTFTRSFANGVAVGGTGARAVLARKRTQRSFSAAFGCEAVLDWLSSPVDLDGDSTCPSLDPNDDDVGPPVWLSEVVVKLSKSGGFSVQEVDRALPPSSLHPASYNLFMKALCAVGDIDQIILLFYEMKKSPTCKPNVLCYNTVINALVVSDRHEEAEELFEEMLSSGVEPIVSTYNIIVKLNSCYRKRFDLAYEVILKMKKCGFAPDAATYSTLVAGLCWDGRVSEAWGVVDWMLEDGCMPTVNTYTPIVQGYCLKGMIEEAKSLMATMESVGCPPNSVTYNIYIDGLSRAGNLNEVERLLKESESKHWIPDAITYNTYMNGLCKQGKSKEAFGVLDAMLKNGVTPTVVTLNILLDCLCHDDNISEAKWLLEMGFAFGWCVDTVWYNTLMSRLCETGRWVGVLKLYTDMLKKGIKHSTRTWNILIQSLCVGGKYQIAKYMINNSDSRPNVVSYNTLIHWFYVEGKMNEIRHLLSSMKTDNVEPDIVTYRIMIDGLCRGGKFLEAVNCFIRSLECDYSADLVLRLIKRLIKNRKLKEIITVFEGIENHGILIDCHLVDASIRMFCREGFCRSSDIFTVDLVLDRMLTKQLP